MSCMPKQANTLKCDGWMDKQMDGWKTDKWKDVWVLGWTDGSMDWCWVGWYGWTDRWMDGRQTDRQPNGLMQVCMGGWMDEWLSGWMDGQTGVREMIRCVSLFRQATKELDSKMRIQTTKSQITVCLP